MSSAVDEFVVYGMESDQNLRGYRVELIDRARDAPLQEVTGKRKEPRELQWRRIRGDLDEGASRYVLPQRDSVAEFSGDAPNRACELVLKRLEIHHVCPSRRPQTRAAQT